MNHLDEVWAWYEAARDSMHLAQQVLSLISPPQLPVDLVPKLVPSDSIFALKPPNEAIQRLRRAQQELDNLTVLALFSTFEQRLLEHFESVIEDMKKRTRNPLRRRLLSNLQERFEKPPYWRREEILDFYKEVIDPQIVGMVKPIAKYRDWVAHPQRNQPRMVDPKTAYDNLKAFLEALS